METGFLNPIHDEEHFSSSFYNQGNGLDETEHMLFGEMIVPEIVDYDNLWPSSDDTGVSGQGQDKTTQKEFQKMLCEWQHQLNYMQEPEVIKQIVPLGSTSTQEVSEMFPSSAPASGTPTPCVDPSIDELFPLETSNRDIPSSENGEEPCVIEETLTARQIKTEPVESVINVQWDSFSIPKDSTEKGVKTAASKIKLEHKTRAIGKGETDEDREKEVDVETVGGEEIPLLMAGDLTSLLEQFEATEKVNGVRVPPSPPRPTSQTIRDALPAEVINRIKASRENHKKMISVIPAMPNKRPGRAATRMQDAGATLSRNKLLKLVTGGSGGESVQLDHDYCTNGGDSTSNSSRSYYLSDSSEYPSQSSTPDTSFSRLPDIIRDSVRACDTGSRKDSGLESGENSDEEVSSLNEGKSKIVLKSSAGFKSVNLVNASGIVIGSGASVIHKNIPMVSVLKKNNINTKNGQQYSSSSTIPVVNKCLSPAAQSGVGCIKVEMDTPEVVKKKKLNLEEYRVRREERERFRSQESSRANSPAPCPTPPAQPDSTTTVGSQEGVPKEKPLMHSVEVQTQTCDFIDLTSSKSSKEQEKSRMDGKGKRNDLKHRSYQSRHASSSSSSSSADSDRHRLSRRKRSSRRRSRSRHRRSSASRMWSRSPSHSSSRSHSEGSSRSRSRSRSRDRRQKWRSRSPRRSNRYDSRSYKNNRDKSRQRNRSPMRGAVARSQDFPTQEKVKQVEERRVIYVGRIDEGTTKADLRKRFQQFGPIVDISVHFRERGDNYGFVTFAYKADAYKAVEHGNDDPKLPRYDLCFGGRRAFCKQRYADLDGLANKMHCQYGPPVMQPRSNESFDLLLNEVKAQLRKRSSV